MCFKVIKSRKCNQYILLGNNASKFKYCHVIEERGRLFCIVNVTIKNRANILKALVSQGSASTPTHRGPKCSDRQAVLFKGTLLPHTAKNRSNIEIKRKLTGLHSRFSVYTF